MRAIRLGTQVLAIVALFALGVMLILDATGVVDGQWRVDAARWFRDAALPDLPDWSIALIGLALAVIGAVMVLAQILPPRRGSHRMHEVHQSADGDTRIRGRAVVKSVRHTVEQIEHVRAADVRWSGKEVQVELQVDDAANLAVVEEQAREALGLPFWIDMGLADVGVNILVVHHDPTATSTRVR
jgi:hypothetical protein